MRVHSVTILSALLIVLFSFSRVLKNDNIGMFACLFQFITANTFFFLQRVFQYEKFISKLGQVYPI